MMMLLFVGGPEDGKRVSINSAPRSRIQTLMLPRRLPNTAPMDPALENLLSAEDFTYATHQIPAPDGRKYYVAYPVDWDQDAYTDPLARITTELMFGYNGRPIRGL